jgi:hypothetical protein
MWSDVMERMVTLASAVSMTKESAVSLAVELLVEEFGRTMKTAHQEDVVILLGEVVEFASAWAVPFNTQQYLDTNDPVHALIPSIIIIPKNRRIAPHVAPSAIETAEYLRSVASGEMPWTIRPPRNHQSPAMRLNTLQHDVEKGESRP